MRGGAALHVTHRVVNPGKEGSTSELLCEGWRCMGGSRLQLSSVHLSPCKHMITYSSLCDIIGGRERRYQSVRRGAHVDMSRVLSAPTFGFLSSRFSTSLCG